jgi:uncharacterized RDD family membrane protein YckC
MTQDLNPYRPPTAEVELDTGVCSERPLAGKGRRFATLLIDYAAFWALSMAFHILLVVIFGSAVIAFYRTGWNLMMSVCLVLGYYFFFEILWGRTPGKMILGTVVTDLKGWQPTSGAIAKRTLARLVPFEAFTFFGQAGFHDKASRTQVVRTR